MAELREAASDAAEAAAVRLRTARQEAAVLRRALDEGQARAAPGVREVVLDSPQAVTTAAARTIPIQPPPAASPRRSLRAAVAHPIWRLVRPVVRPVLWRARAFFTADALRGLAELRTAQEALQQAVRDAATAALDERSVTPPAPAAAAPRRAYNAPPGAGTGSRRYGGRALAADARARTRERRRTLRPPQFRPQQFRPPGPSPPRRRRSRARSARAAPPPRPRAARPQRRRAGGGPRRAPRRP